MQEIQPISPASRRDPVPMSQALFTALSNAYRALMEGGELTAAKLPSGARLGLETRRRELAPLLAPAAPERIVLILSTLDGMTARAEMDPDVARVAMKRDIADLSGLPEFALAAAARAYRKGEIGDGKWRPTAGEIAKLARAKADEYREELAKIEAVLSAKVALSAPPTIGLEDRKRLGDMLRRTVDQMQAREIAGEQALKAKSGRPEDIAKLPAREPAPDELAARYRASPVQLSERHRAAMGLAPAGTEEAAQCA